MQIIVKNTIQEQNELVARDIAKFIRENPGSLLCFAAGDTPLGAFKELIKLQAAGEVDLNSVYYVGLDEWVGLGYETRGSCVQVMRDTYYTPAGITEDHMAIWDGLADPQEEIKRIAAFIQAHGHINFTLLGIGMNGHIGFNEPGTGLPEGGILVDLDNTTKTVSVKYFDTALPVKQGEGVGAGELKKANKIFLMANEARKQDIVYKIVKEPATPDVPASMIVDHADITLYLDEAAAAKLN